MSRRLGTDELRKLFLFEALDDTQLQWLADRGVAVPYTAGDPVYREGETATCFVVLLSGMVSLSRNVRGDDIELSRTDQVGVYGGATQAYLGDRVPQVYNNTMHAITDVEVYELPAVELGAAMRQWFPMAMHLLEGLFFGMRNTNNAAAERERLLALGALSAGLTHELNNPAAAAVRATAVLRDRIAGMRHKLAMIADGRLDGEQLHGLVELQERAVKLAANAPKRSPLDTSDAEDAIGDWLDERGVNGAWDLAPTLVAGGVDVPWLEDVKLCVGKLDLEPAVRWLVYTIETELLMGEIDDAVSRISGLVSAAKQYSQLDRGPFQVVDVHELLDATLIMLNAKITKQGVRVVTKYDRELPPIPAYAAELNQVWTNLIDNAVAAMHGSGTLTITTSQDGECLAVEFADTGTGIPDDVRPRIFEPFFTTKPVGEGTGLGLDISYRIVVKKHHGDIRVTSVPGDTRFTVLLPLTEPVPAA
ncbi:cyclic nucleotide-binding domain-containing protein [Dactylosporangium aurantiacum]|uniref:histidine kinase n=1 Tax=Dactylosporangium aurantiacum TaxID=35754 RepID=A0A9Q9IEC9_9ACTN|nr:ATP-binding protein [Dactylosporangium aurantiacum]MDG6105133.1 ATP-binding protein [Dactylosporangium aurantiacum]UWZ51658.1 cyclic nucleotide-binding domain-containing protein [Dactylosporangium aurantiacum]